MSAKVNMKTKSQLKKQRRKQQPKMSLARQVRKAKNMGRTPKITSVTKPLAEGYRRKYKKPTIKTTRSGVCISHSEYIGNLSGTADLSFIRFRINPADPFTFPWLSTLAGSYEKFVIKKMHLRYVKNCSSVTQGYVYAYPDYDPNRDPMYQEEQFFNTMDVTEGSAWVNFTMPIRKKFDLAKKYLIRSPYETYDNYLLYDPLNVYVGTAGTGDSPSLGRIYIDYEIELCIPDPEGGLKFYNTESTLTNCTPVGDGSYKYPSPVTGTQVMLAGNYWLQPTATGFKFTDTFVGILTLVIQVDNGFDPSYPPGLTAPPGGEMRNVGIVLNDTTFLGKDDWMLVYNVKAKRNDVTNWIAGFSSSATNPFTIYVYMASSNPSYLDVVDPRLVFFGSRPPLNKRITYGRTNPLIMPHNQEHIDTYEDESEFDEDLFHFLKKMEVRKKEPSLHLTPKN